VRFVVGQARTCATSIMGRVYGGVSTIPPNVMDTLSLSNTAMLELRQTTIRRQSVAGFVPRLCPDGNQLDPGLQQTGNGSLVRIELQSKQ